MPIQRIAIGANINAQQRLTQPGPGRFELGNGPVERARQHDLLVTPRHAGHTAQAQRNNQAPRAHNRQPRTGRNTLRMAKLD